MRASRRTSNPREARTARRDQPGRREQPARRATPATPDWADAADALGAGAIVGRHPVLEALKSGRPINKILVADSAEGGSLTEILGRARSAGIVVQSVPRQSLSRMFGDAHQGVAAYVAPRAYVELDDVIARDTGQPPLVLLLDEVTDPANFGAILRTAEATAVQGVVIPKRRAVPLTEAVAKAAAGAVEYVPVARVANLVQAMERLKEAGYWLVGADVAGAHLYTEVDYRGAMALVIGAEGKGLSRLVKEHCDYLVRLPMLGHLQSLNASVAAGVMLYEVVRQRA
ncbi:23S rRNA (guanosine(2251)-2'-O)-methyltransferase RlmB [Alicyclobacillus macrosporangiidus]|uniref:23S rRNA (Guanosine2251-2'-O)-methyltransferase n=1 Tax=Alicyclobacillus macrosporangiidus TaxID=392015 RepID=A0A1I7I5V5_9BACL|nr:23S rRNA (guanosine(2251)-2'-O)-methyltransferase RlmB [Alicyclobacillus macrosporangiidus]SFU68340.1 23S rRNA (guanosine2251-2'-O)-methyltransferase [Alicyclobacillus macrosporangiidus]